MTFKHGLAVSMIAILSATGAFAQDATAPSPALTVGEAVPPAVPGLIAVEPFGPLNAWAQEVEGGSDPEYYFHIPEVGYVIGYPYTIDGDEVALAPLAPPEAEAAEETDAGDASGASLLESIESWDASDEDKALAADFVTSIAGAKSQEEMNRAILEWRERNADAPIAADAQENAATAPGYPVTSPANIGAPFGQEGVITPPVPLAPASPQAGASVQPPGTSAPTAEQTAAAVQELASELHATLEDESFWFAAGPDTGVPVYMMVDPECPYCARMISDMTPDIESGKIQLRIVLTPVLSALSLDRAAAILVSEDPQKAVLDHARDRLESGLVASEIKFDALPESIRALIDRNVGILRESQMPGIPVTVFKTADGFGIVSGYEERSPWKDAVR